MEMDQFCPVFKRRVYCFLLQTISKISVAYNNKHLFFSFPDVQVSLGSSASGCGFVQVSSSCPSFSLDQQSLGQVVSWLENLRSEWTYNTSYMTYMPTPTTVSSTCLPSIGRSNHIQPSPTSMPQEIESAINSKRDYLMAGS